MVHSPSHWPGSSGWGRSGRTPDLRHFADTGTGLWPAGTRSPRAQYTGCVQYPGSYMCTLKGEKRLIKISFDFWSIANVQHRAFSFHSESDSHSCSFVGKHPRNSRSCRCHSWDLQCCKDTCYTLRSDCHRHSRLTCLCCCYTGTAGSALLAERGYRNNPGHIPHIGHLGWEKEEEIVIIYGQSREEEDMMAKIVLHFPFCAVILGWMIREEAGKYEIPVLESVDDLGLKSYMAPHHEQILKSFLVKETC